MSDVIRESIKKMYLTRVIDNRSVRLIEAFEELLPKATRFDMAVGYFYTSGFELVNEPFQQLMDNPNATIRVLMGNKTNTATLTVLREGITPEEALLRDIEEHAESHGHELHELAGWMRQGRLAVKVYTGEANYFHAKSYLFHTDRYSMNGYTIVGSSNFSVNGLTGNTELNTMSQDNFIALCTWFEQIWNSNEVKEFSPELIRAIEEKVPSVVKEQQPYLTARATYLEFARRYARPPIELSNSDYLDELYPHQRIGVAEIKNRLQMYGTALLCDGVGLGKTRTAAGVIREIGLPRTLIIVASKLQAQWREELAVVEALSDKIEFLSKEQITRMSASKLRELTRFELIIIDEAHQGIKNSGTKLYRNLEYVQERAEHHILGLLLTATPWNNSRRDIFNLGSLFLDLSRVSSSRPYAEYLRFAPRKAAKAFEVDDDAFKTFWEDLFLQRTRKTYGGQEVTFAERQFPVVEIIYEPGKERAFDANYQRISELHLPYMNPLRYLDDEGDEFASDRLKLLFLKRADSSWIAFQTTLEKIMSKLETLVSDLTHINQHPDMKKQFIRWFSDSYNLTNRFDDFFRMYDITVGEDLTDYEATSLENRNRYVRKLNERISKIEKFDKRKVEKLINSFLTDASADLLVLNTIREELGSAFKRKDEKYEAIRNTLLNCIETGEKVLIITQFRDTALDYFERFVKDTKLKHVRIGLVTGMTEDCRIGNGKIVYTKEDILKRFAPISKKAPEYQGSEEIINVVIGTETLAVGQNLQDARTLMNLDLPYNPMNLEQRIGRIDRPRSDGQVRHIDIYTFPSMPVIEAELKMTERLRKKLVGIFTDTMFDDLVLPEYEDFLKNALHEREQIGQAVETMIDKTVEKQIVPVDAMTHNTVYQEAQKRMWEVLQSGSQLQLPDEVVDTSASFKIGGNTVAICKTDLRDVNGNLIKTVSQPFLFGDSISEDWLAIETSWFEALQGFVRTTGDLPKEKALHEKQVVEAKLQEITRRNIEAHNAKIGMVRHVEDQMIETRARKVATDIMAAARGSNKVYIAQQIKASGYELKSLKTLADSILYIDARDAEFVDVLDLYQDLKQLWTNYNYYYERFVGKEHTTRSTEQINVKKGKNEGRPASMEQSKTIWEIGHISVI